MPKYIFDLRDVSLGEIETLFRMLFEQDPDHPSVGYLALLFRIWDKSIDIPLDEIDSTQMAEVMTAFTTELQTIFERMGGVFRD